jgi:hypothetical protein
MPHDIDDPRDYTSSETRSTYTRTIDVPSLQRGNRMEEMERTAPRNRAKELGEAATV